MLLVWRKEARRLIALGEHRRMHDTQRIEPVQQETRISRLNNGGIWATRDSTPDLETEIHFMLLTNSTTNRVHPHPKAKPE